MGPEDCVFKKKNMVTVIRNNTVLLHFSCAYTITDFIILEAFFD